jgi:hypothetical protein
MLPLDHHPGIEKLSGPIHHVKNCLSKLYAWVNKPNMQGGCNATQSQLGVYMLAQYKCGTKKNCTFEKSERAAKASFQQH